MSDCGSLQLMIQTGDCEQTYLRQLKHQQTTNFVTVPTSFTGIPQTIHKPPQTHKESQGLQNINWLVKLDIELLYPKYIIKRALFDVPTPFSYYVSIIPIFAIKSLKTRKLRYLLTLWTKLDKCCTIEKP